MQSLPPVFVKSNVSFKLVTPKVNQDVSFLNQEVSLFGISGVKTGLFTPSDHVGEQVSVDVDVLVKDRFKFSTPAIMTAEITSDSNYLGFKFYLTQEVRTRLAEAIQAEGYYPTHYVRKYPRIPAWGNIPTMPLRAVAQTNDQARDLIVFDIANMSPNGILLHSENPKASFYTPGTRIEAQVEPRGTTFNSFRFEGVVCRVMLDKNPQTKNMTRFIGIRFMRLDDREKENFLEILRAILISIQTEGNIR